MIDFRSRPLLIIRTPRQADLVACGRLVKGGDWSVLASLFTDTVLGVCADALSLVLVHL